MRIWFTSDFHFGHENIIKFCNRPCVDVEHMNQYLVRNYNNLVDDDDLCYILGDFAFANSKTISHILKSMKGRKILIRGNHDRGTMDKYPFEFVFDELVLTYKGIRFRLSHYPYFVDEYEKSFGSDLRYACKRPVYRPGEVLLHGHTHLAPKDIKRCEDVIWSSSRYGDSMSKKISLDVGVDGHNWCPWQIDEIIKELNL